ncbi:MAG TPA: D-glycero-beta-D-manno-heptose 1,7-bisphosphate 7-phosphatase [Thiolinea sp.]|mgnify:CR=1 FL=1|nr:D-glycero-beta-D-manno-heptose 1,7-bisphosphate 7-phosphatase [Thiolinea sp.]
MNPALQLVILDRDGVINVDSDDYIRTVAQWIPVDGSLAAIATLNRAGLKVAVATNQSGIGRGYYSLETLEGMHARLQTLLARKGGHIDALHYCPHVPEDHCRCRKPLPGMLLALMQQFAVGAEECCFVGDSHSDFRAAEAAGMAFHLVRTGKGERTLAAHPGLACAGVWDSLAQFAAVLPTLRAIPAVRGSHPGQA